MAELQTSPDVNSSNNKKRTPRGSSYTPLEDAGIAKAWIAVSENAITGAEQKREEFIFQVSGKYNTFFRPNNRDLRSFESIKTRVKLIIKNCTLFSACYARVVRSKPTGVSQSDIIRLATALFNNVEVCNAADDVGKPFKFKEAREILKDHEKFMAGSTKQGTNAGDSTSETDGDAHDVTSEMKVEAKPKERSRTARPVGRRKAKDDVKDEAYKRDKLRLASESVETEKERVVVLKRHYELLLFKQAPDGCDEAEAVEYFKTMRARALKELREECKKPRLQSKVSEESNLDKDNCGNEKGSDGNIEK